MTKIRELKNKVIQTLLDAQGSSRLLSDIDKIAGAIETLTRAEALEKDRSLEDEPADSGNIPY